MWLVVFCVLVVITGGLLYLQRRRRQGGRIGIGRRLLIGAGAALPFIAGDAILHTGGLSVASVVLFLGIGLLAAVLVHMGERFTGRP